MESHSAVIDHLGGYAKLAESLGLPTGTVSSMKTRNSIPSEHWNDVARVAVEQGKPEVTVGLLATLQPPRQRRQASAPSTAPDPDDLAPPKAEPCE